MFPWGEQVAVSNRLQQISPTLTLTVEEGVNSIWVSAYNVPEDLFFVSECFLPDGEAPKLFSSGTKQVVENLHSEEFKIAHARQALGLFAEGKRDQLRELYANNA